MYILKILLIWFVFMPMGISDELEDFIGDDKELAVLNLDMEDVFNYFEPEMLMQQVDPDDYAQYDQMSPDEINAELERLHDALERVYNVLLAFARVLVSMTTVDFVQLAEELKKNDSLTEKLLQDHFINTNLPSELTVQQFNVTADEGDEEDHAATDALIAYLSGNDWTDYLEESNEGDDLNDGFGEYNSDPTQDYGDLKVYDENGEVDSSVEYWDPTEEYEMLIRLFDNDPEDMDVLQKMGLLTLIKKILAKIKAIIYKIKKKFVILLKLIKLKLYIKKIRVLICLKIMYLIEKIKRLIKLIIKLIKKIIRYLIKELPWEVLWEIKVVIKFLLRILSDILWEAEILLLEILVKVVKLLKVVKKIPVEIVYYFKVVLLQKLKMLKQDVNDKLQFKRMNYYEKVWSGYEEQNLEDMSDGSFEASPYDNNDGEPVVVQDGQDNDIKASSTSNRWDYDGTPDIVYSQSSDVHIPEEFLEIFGAVFTEDEMAEYLKGDDSFSFDFVWPVVDESAVTDDPVETEKFNFIAGSIQVAGTEEVEPIEDLALLIDSSHALEDVAESEVTHDLNESKQSDDEVDDQADSNGEVSDDYEDSNDEANDDKTNPSETVEKRQLRNDWISPDDSGELIFAQLSDMEEDYEAALDGPAFHDLFSNDVNLLSNDEQATPTNATKTIPSLGSLMSLDSKIVVTSIGVIVGFVVVVFFN